MESFISIENASLRFRRWRNPSPALKEAVVAKLGRKSSANAVETFESLKNINLNIKGGDRLGIIGLNGAGKSTLLKMVVGIYTPTQGCVRVNGKITPLIELGTGFDHELSGRENIYLNGSMLGRSFRQMQAYEKEIIEFSELEEFIDQPIKYYSSGMHGRLAFSIATTLEPEILLIDEVFSTGDAHFVGKAQARMHNLLNTSHIVVIVTHNMQHIREFCNRVIYLHRGEVMYDGSPDQAIDYYLEAIGQPPEKPSAAKKVKQQSVEDAVDHTERVQLHEVIRVLKEENTALRTKAKETNVLLTASKRDDSFFEHQQISNSLAKHHVAVKQPLVLISQVQRSGGMLLSRLFDGHPQLHVHPHELCIGYPQKTNWPILDLTDSPDKWFGILSESSMINAFWKSYSRKHAVVKDFDVFQFVLPPTIQKRLFETVCAKDKPTTQRDVINAYMSSFFNAWLDNKSSVNEVKKYVTGYVASLSMETDSLERFFNDYPDGYLISIVRDPRSWFASARVHSAHLFGSLDAALDAWELSAKSALKASERYGNRVKIVRFEDLVLKTKETMQELCSLLEIDFHDCLLTPTFNTLPTKADSTFFDNQYSISRDSVEVRPKMLLAEELLSIEQRTTSLYEKVFESVV